MIAQPAIRVALPCETPWIFGGRFTGRLSRDPHLAPAVDLATLVTPVRLRLAAAAACRVNYVESVPVEEHA